jgi:hypothetical protein
MRNLGAWAVLAGAVAFASIGCSADAGTSSETSDAVVSAPDVTKAVSDLKDANDAVDEVERRLSDETQIVGGALTRDQRDAYTAAFGAVADVKAAHDAQNAAALALEKALKDLIADDAKIKQAMEGGRLWVSKGEVGYKQIYLDMKLLARSPVATFPLEFAAKLIAGDAEYTGKTLTLAKFRKDAKDIMADIIVPALPKAAALELAKSSNEASAKAVLKARLAPMLDLLNDPDKLSGLHDQVDAINQILDLVDTRLQDIVDADGNLRFAKLDASVVNVNIALQAVNAIFGLWRAGLDISAFKAGDMSAFMSLLETGPDSVAGLAEAANNIRGVIVGNTTVGLADVAKFAGQVAAGVGIVMASIDAFKDIKGAIDDHGADKSTVLKIFGDFLSITSGGLAFVSAVNPFVGPALAVAAILVDLYIDHIAKEKRMELEAAELPKLLAAAGLDDATVAAFSGLDPKAGKVISGLAASPGLAKHPGAGLSPETIQWLGRSSPELLHKVGFGQNGSDRVAGLTVVVRTYGLDATHARELLDASVAGTADADVAEVLFDAFEIMRGVEHDDPTASDAKATVLKDIQAQASSSDAKRKAAATALAAYLQAH